jgi:hypothetical protein
MSKKQSTAVLLHGVRHDVVAYTAALVLTTSTKNIKGMTSIEELLKEVQECFKFLKISTAEICKRLQEWAEKKWITWETSNTREHNEEEKSFKFKITPEGRKCLDLLAKEAV